MDQTTPPASQIALLYDDDGYVEASPPPGSGLVGLLGRQVAGKEFLDAYFTHGSWESLAAVVYNQHSLNTLTQYCRQHPSATRRKRQLNVVDGTQFHQTFLPTPPAPLLYTPCPPDASFAWARQFSAPGSFALCGVTHTLATAAGLTQLCDLVTAPYEPYDALICTSRAVQQMVRAVAGSYADYLKDRHGGAPEMRLRLETIPLGVNAERYRPPTLQERAAQRRAFQIADDEVAVLFVGRLAAHAKAHPAALFLACAEAARTTGRKVHLLLAGWGFPDMLRAIDDGARALAPELRVSVIDGTHPQVRYDIWHAADIFAALADSLQEYFGLSVLEAMACGLPVVASDWDGFKDLIVDGVTGFRVPTYLLHDATTDTMARLLTMGELEYEPFLAETNQAVAVDIPAAAEALSELIQSVELRRRLGDAGRRRVHERFTWQHVIAAYETLWKSQEVERRARAARSGGKRRSKCPPVEQAYAGYPTDLLPGDVSLAAVPGGADRLDTLLALPLTNYAERRRVREAAALREVLAAAGQGCPMSQLDRVLEKAGANRVTSRATLAWLLKYGLLKVQHVLARAA